MAQFQGYICDSCDAIIRAGERIRVKTRYEGPTEGDVKYDLCADCIYEEVERHEAAGRKVEPIKRRRKRKSTDAQETPPSVPSGST